MTARLWPLRGVRGLLVMLTVLAFAGPAWAQEDPVKEALREMKELACGLDILLATGEDPLTDEELQMLFGGVLLEMDAIGWPLLEDEDSPLYTPAPTMASWSIVDTEGMGLHQLVSSSCEAACEALRDYCEWLENGGGPEYLDSAAKWLHQCLLLCPEIAEEIGL